MTYDHMEENPVRSRILFFIEQNPGSSFSLLSRSLEVNQSSLRYHLTYLERRGEIVLKFLKGERVVYPGNGSNESNVNSRAVRSMDPQTKRILSIIRSKPGADIQDILEMTNLSKRDMNMTLHRLVRSKKIVSIEKEKGMNPVFYLTSEYYDIMFRYLVGMLLNEEIDEEVFLRRKFELDVICCKSSDR